jgi:hypothetical protein
MAQDDPLLSASQVARTWGTGLDIVVSLVEGEALPSLDRGDLIRKGHLDIPLIRRSWAEFLRDDYEATGRVLPPPRGATVHPAFNTAFAVHAALAEGDAETLYDLSSLASRNERDAQTLLARWNELNDGGYPDNSGVGSNIYSLHPLPAVAARVLADAPPVPRAVVKPTPATLLAVLPLVSEDGDWKVDLPLYEGPVWLPELLSTPLDEPSETDAET